MWRIRWLPHCLLLTLFLAKWPSQAASLTCNACKICISTGVSSPTVLGWGGMFMWDRASCGTQGCMIASAMGSLPLLIESKRRTNLPHTHAFYFLLKLYNSYEFSCFLGRRWLCWNYYGRLLETLRPCNCFPSNPKDFQNMFPVFNKRVWKKLMRILNFSF